MAAQCSEVVLPASFKYATLDAFRYRCRFLQHASGLSAMMQFWIKAASMLPYTDDVGRSVVETLFDMVSSHLSPHIPMVAWDWLNRRPVLPPKSVAFRSGAIGSMVQIIRELRDTRLIVSYLHIIWSEWCQLGSYGVLVMRQLIREELGGIGAAEHHTDLIQKLDYVLSQLDQLQGVSLLLVEGEYEELRRELLEVDEEAMGILTGMLSSYYPVFIH